MISGATVQPVARPTAQGWCETSRHFWAMRFRPADPIWASKEKLARLRRELTAYDRQLTVWWSKTHRGQDPVVPGRWRIVRYKPGGGWSTVFYWEGPNGEFRDIEPPLPILELVKRADEALDVRVAKIEARNESIMRQRAADRSEWVRRGVLDLHRHWIQKRLVIPIARIQP